MAQSQMSGTTALRSTRGGPLPPRDVPHRRTVLRQPLVHGRVRCPRCPPLRLADRDAERRRRSPSVRLRVPRDPRFRARRSSHLEPRRPRHGPGGVCGHGVLAHGLPVGRLRLVWRRRRRPACARRARIEQVAGRAAMRDRRVSHRVRGRFHRSAVWSTQRAKRAAIGRGSTHFIESGLKSSG